MGRTSHSTARLSANPWSKPAASDARLGERPADLRGRGEAGAGVLDRRGGLVDPCDVGDIGAERRILEADPDMAAVRDRGRNQGPKSTASPAIIQCASGAPSSSSFRYASSPYSSGGKPKAKPSENMNRYIGAGTLA